MKQWQRAQAARRTAATLISLLVIGAVVPQAVAANSRQHRRDASSRSATSSVSSITPTTAVAPTTPEPESLTDPESLRRGLMVSFCGFSHRSTSDPIVHPGMSGMSHSHDFFGNETTNADSTLQSLAGQPTTCHIAGDQAAYWVPTMYENGKVLPAMGILAYFHGAKFGPTEQLPYGLKIVAGGRRNTGFTCFDHSMPHAESRRVPSCSPTQHLAMAVHFPDCWNGRDLDSADHRSHMAYAEAGICPSTHPVHVAKLGLWVIYKVPGNRQNLQFSSGGLETAHADFFNSFDPATQATLHDYCIIGRRTCYKQMWQVLTKLGLKQQRVVLKQDQS